MLNMTDQPFNRYETPVADQDSSELIVLQRKQDEPQRRNKQKRNEEHEIVTERILRDRRPTRMRKSLTLKLKEFDGSTPVEVFLQQFKACSQCYKCNDEECCLQLRDALSGDTAILIWSQSEPDKHSFNQLRRLLRERYGSEKQEEKFQAELRNRRQRINEDLPTLRTDASRLMALAYPGDVSPLSQEMARDAFLTALDDVDFETRIRESEPRTLDDAYNRALRLEVIRKGVQQKEMPDVLPAKHGKQTRAIDVDVINSALNAEYQRKIEELQFNAQKNLDEMKVQNKKTQDSLFEQITHALSELKTENKKMQELLLKQDKKTETAVGQPSITQRDFSKVKCYNSGALGHTRQLEHFKKDCPGQTPKLVQRYHRQGVLQ